MTKPLTRYWQYGASSQMKPDELGQWYAKDEADAVIADLNGHAEVWSAVAAVRAKRIAELEAEVVEWRGQRDQWAGLCVTMERRIKQLDEEAQDYSDRLEKGEFLDQAKNDRIYRLQAKCAELEAERDAARADAERYRWLRDTKDSEALREVKRRMRKNWDAAIDSARGVDNGR